MADYTYGIGEELQFNAPDGALSHTWDFGDTVTSNEPNPTHIYTAPGIYEVSHIAESFCGRCDIAVIHTVEIVEASIVVSQVLLDKYMASIGDTINITVVAVNQSNVYGTNTIVTKVDNDVISTNNVTLNPQEQVTYTIPYLVTKSGSIEICADTVCVTAFVESSIIIDSIVLNNNVSSGDPIIATITLTNTSLIYQDQRDIVTTIRNEEILTADERTVTIDPGGTQSFDVPIDVRNLAQGPYAICADSVCKAFYVITSETVGTIEVTSNPQGAEIFIDGNDTNQVTPYSITNLTPAIYTLKLTLDGYETYEGSIEVIAGEVTRQHIVLTPKVSIIPTLAKSDMFWVVMGASALLAKLQTQKEEILLKGL